MNDMRNRFGGAVLLWIFASAVLAQAVTPTPAPASGAAVAPLVGAESKDAPGTASVQDEMSGKRGSRGNRFDQKAPMNVRIKDSGIKLPKCAEESREGEACK
jgi:hypothetical protein